MKSTCASFSVVLADKHGSHFECYRQVDEIQQHIFRNWTESPAIILRSKVNGSQKGHGLDNENLAQWKQTEIRQMEEYWHPVVYIIRHWSKFIEEKNEMKISQTLMPMVRPRGERATAPASSVFSLRSSFPWRLFSIHGVQTNLYPKFTIISATWTFFTSFLRAHLNGIPLHGTLKKVNYLFNTPGPQIYTDSTETKHGLIYN